MEKVIEPPEIQIYLYFSNKNEPITGIGLSNQCK